MPANITKTSRAPEVQILKMGQTTNKSFGSNPSARVKGSRTTTDVAAPTAKS